jgi:hypothetical protein
MKSKETHVLGSRYRKYPGGTLATSIEVGQLLNLCNLTRFYNLYNLVLKLFMQIYFSSIVLEAMNLLKHSQICS